MSKLLIAILFSAFAITTYAADTDKQTDGAELGTNETPQAQDQSNNNQQHKSSNRHTKKHHHSKKKMNTNQQDSSSSENNPLQPTESETAPGASTK